MKHKELYVLLDSDHDIVETFPENSSFDYMFQRKQSTCPYGTLHKAVLYVGPEQHERNQTNTEPVRAATSVKTNLKQVHFNMAYSNDEIYTGD